MRLASWHATPHARATAPLSATRRGPILRGVTLRLFALAASALLASCAFHTTATQWHGLVGVDGKPIFVKGTTNVGINLFILLPLFGNVTIDTMLDETAGEIAKSGSNGIRVIQTNAEVYWYGFPPFTWIVTPVVTNVAIEYHPSQAELDAELGPVATRTPTAPAPTSSQRGP